MTTNSDADDATLDPAVPAPAPAPAVSASLAAQVAAYQPDLALRGLSEAVWATWGPPLRARALVAAHSRAHASSMLGASLSLLAWALTSRLPVSTHPDLLWAESTRGRYLRSLEDAGVAKPSVTTAKSLLARMAAAVVSDPAQAAGPASIFTPAGLEVGSAIADDREPVPVSELGLAEAPVYWALLRAIGTRVRSVHPDACRPGSLRPGRDKAIPYGLTEVSRLLRAAPTLPVASTRDGARAYLALGLGAGIDGSQLAYVRPGDIRDDPDTDEVRVAVRSDWDTIARWVPVLAPFAPLLLQLRTASGDRPLVRGRNGSKNTQNRPSNLATSLAAKDPHAVRADSTRLRATWLAIHLACGTPLPLLQSYAGLTTATPFDSLYPYVPVPECRPSQPWVGRSFGPEVTL